jgi:hypothetical protein
MALAKLRINETDENRVRKLNALVDAINALGVSSTGTIDAAKLTGTVAPARLPIATASTLGAVKDGTGITVAADGTMSVP